MPHSPSPPRPPSLPPNKHAGQNMARRRAIECGNRQRRAGTQAPMRRRERRRVGQVSHQLAARYHKEEHPPCLSLGESGIANEHPKAKG